MPTHPHRDPDVQGSRPAPASPTRPTGIDRRSALAVLGLGLVTACAPSGDARERGVSTASRGSSPRVSTRYDAATRGDTAFNSVFRHEFADVDGVRMHYVTGGQGPPLVLLHEWPQSWYAWRGIMPALARRHTVYAVDLPGLGDSRGAPASYDKATLARYLHLLLRDRLGLGPVSLAAHDLGAGVGFQYATQFPDLVKDYAHLDYPLPGPALSAATYRTFSWHLAFQTQERIPEFLVEDDVRRYLAEFYKQVAYGGVAYGGPGAESPFTRGQINEFARTYRRPQVLTGGFELYRTLEQDEMDNKAAGRVPVDTLLMAAEGGLAAMRATTRPLLTNVVQAVEVPRAGHWLPEENPRFVTARLLAFFDR